MARKKKFIKYTFEDGEREIPSTVKVKCSVTGKDCSIYHKQAVKLINDQFGNEYGRFISEYVSRDGKKESGEGDLTDDENTRPKLYAGVLKLQYMAELDISKRQQIAEVYQNRYGESIV